MPDWLHFRRELESEKALLRSREQEIRALRQTTDMLANKVQDQEDSAQKQVRPQTDKMHYIYVYDI